MRHFTLFMPFAFAVGILFFAHFTFNSFAAFINPLPTDHHPLQEESRKQEIHLEFLSALDSSTSVDIQLPAVATGIYLLRVKAEVGEIFNSTKLFIL